MSFLANPIANISGGIHDLGKSTLGKMAETAALTYFLGPLAAEGGALAGMSTAGLAGLAGGTVSLLNGGNLMDAVKSGALAYGAGSLMGGDASAAKPSADVNFDVPAKALASPVAQEASLVPSSVANLTSATPQWSGLPPDLQAIEPQATATPVQAPVAPAPAAPVPAAPNYSGQNIFTGQAPLNNPIASGPIGTNPNSTSFFSGLKNKFMGLEPWQQAGIGAAGLMALKGMAKNNSVAKAPDNRRLKFYGGNPYSGAGAMYETPTLAANGGIVALAKGGRIENGVRRFDVAGSVDAAIGAGQAGFAPGTSAQDVVTNYGLNAQQARQVAQVLGYTGDLSGLSYAPSVSAVPSISNAVTAAAPATTVAATPAAQSAAVQAAIDAGKQGFAQGTSAQDVITNFNLNQEQAKQVAQALGYTGDLNGLTYNTPTTTKAPSLLGLAALDASITGNPNATPAQAGQVAIDRTYLNSIMNPTAADLASLNGATAADKAAVINKAINAANNIYGGNNAVSQKVIAQLMDVWHINPDTVQSALGSGYTGPSVQSLYSAVDPALTAGATASWANQGAYNPATVVDNKTNSTAAVVDPNTLASSLGLPKGTYKTVNDVYSTYATSLGLPAGNYASIADIKAAIMAMSVTPKTPTTQPPVNLAPVVNLAPTTTVPGVNSNGYYVPATGPTTTSNGQTYTPGYISNTTNATTAPGVSGSHASVNPNGSISQAPAMPFRPLGGYGTLQAAKDAWTQSGGSLGHVNPVAQPVTTDAGTQHYLDILSGKAPASKVPYTPNGVIAAPYYSSVMGMPLNPKYEVSQPGNPNYDPKFSPSADYIGAYAPGYTGEAAPALDPKTIAFLQGKGVDVGTNPTAASASSSASTSGAPVTLPNKVTATPLTSYPGYLKGNDGKYYDLKGNLVANDDASFNALVNEVPAANGGLMGLAAGGLGNLGGYSDGGRLLRGPGDGISDSIPATIGGRQPARLADGEFVVPARIVSEIGNGSTEAGARKLYQMMDRVQNARKKTTGKQQVAANPRAEQYLPA